MGQMEMKCISNIGENNISILAKATQVSDVAHGPIVFFILGNKVLLRFGSARHLNSWRVLIEMGSKLLLIVIFALCVTDRAASSSQCQLKRRQIKHVHMNSRDGSSGSTNNNNEGNN
jgi:hypothetical protein